MTASLEILAEKCDLLGRENDTLRERVAWLEGALSGGRDGIPIPGLTKSESRVLGCIAGSENGASKNRVYSAIYSDRVDDPPDPKIVDVFICKIRKKLAPLGIEIETVWGWGFRLPATSRSALDALRSAIA